MLSQAVLLALISPGLVVTITLTVTGTIGVMTWVPDPSIWQPMKTIGKFVFPNLTPLAEGDIVRIGLAGLAWFTIAMAGVLVWRRGQSLVAMPEMSLPDADVASAPGHLRLTLLWLACPLLLPLVLSKVFEPFYVDRYSICAAPAVYYLLALAVVCVSSEPSRFWCPSRPS